MPDFTFTDIIRDFARYGHVETPLTAAQIDRLMALGVARDDIYGIGCDCACGFRFEESLAAYFNARAAT